VEGPQAVSGLLAPEADAVGFLQTEYFDGCHSGSRAVSRRLAGVSNKVYFNRGAGWNGGLNTRHYESKELDAGRGTTVVSGTPGTLKASLYWAIA